MIIINVITITALQKYGFVSSLHTTHVSFLLLNIQHAQSLVLIRRTVSYSYLIILIATASYYATSVDKKYIN